VTAGAGYVILALIERSDKYRLRVESVALLVEPVMAIECALCTTSNADNAKFCSECGNALDRTINLSRELVRSQVREIIAERYKDQKVVEIETTQAIADRFLGWSKLLAFVAGIPIALLFLILSILGIKTYTDFSTQVDKARADVTAELASAQVGAKKLKEEGDSLASDYRKLRTQLADTAALGEQVKSLSAKVDVIGEKLGFTPTSKISPEARNQIEAAFAKFQNYVRGLGHQGTAGPISIDVREKMEFPAIAYYDPGKRMMVIDSKYISELAVIYREYMHHVFYPNGIPERLPNYYAIESGLAWYFPCSFIGDPSPAKNASSWDLTRKRKFAEMRPEISSAMIDGTEIWGSAFWELRQILGQGAADKLLFDAWFALGAGAVKNDDGAAFVRKLISLDMSHESQIRAVFVQRGLSL
jgi:hypothetical protein